MDRSPTALETAQKNAQSLAIESRVQLLQRDWNETGWADDLGQFDLILCNPPYVEVEAELEPDVRDFEPSEALFAGRDGLDDYRILVPQLRGLMKNNAIAILEIGHAQAEAVSHVACAHGFTVEIKHDLANRSRAVVLR